MSHFPRACLSSKVKGIRWQKAEVTRPSPFPQDRPVRMECLSPHQPWWVLGTRKSSVSASSHWTEQTNSIQVPRLLHFLRCTFHTHMHTPHEYLPAGNLPIASRSPRGSMKNICPKLHMALSKELASQNRATSRRFSSLTACGWPRAALPPCLTPTELLWQAGPDHFHRAISCRAHSLSLLTPLFPGFQAV